MRRALVIAAVLALMPLAGCVPLLSLHPLWDETTNATVPALVGTWSAEDGDETLVIQQRDDHEYGVVYSTTDHSQKATSRYTMHAVKLGEYLFLDFAPDEHALDECTKTDAYLPVVPAHFFARAVLTGDRLELGSLDDDAFIKKVKADNVDIRFEELELENKETILSAGTSDIQKFVLKYATDPDLWQKTDFHRVPNAGGNGLK
ncbi:MAG: hypothetical protein ABSC02_06755 [Acidobacteriota bacterium]